MIRCIHRKYRDIFGIPNKGVHSYKIAGCAIIDYILTILSSIVIAYFTNFPLVLTTIVMLVLGIIFHSMFAVNTHTIKFLGLECK